MHACGYHSQLEDYHEADKLLPSSEFSALTVKTTPASYRCTPNQPQDAQAVVDRFSGQPGVLLAQAPNQQIHAMEETITVLQWVFVAVALVLLLSAGVLILNTIRMAIFARRREVSVMKLVGATNWFIRLPFMSEGLIQGLIGSVVAASLVFGLHQLLNSLSNSKMCIRDSGMAELRPGHGEWHRRGAPGPHVRHGPHRDRLRSLRRPSRPHLRRRAHRHRAALLRQLPFAGLHAGG